MIRKSFKSKQLFNENKKNEKYKEVLKKKLVFSLNIYPVFFVKK